MSFTILEDGTGNGYKAKVNASNHLLVGAINVEEITSISSNRGGALNFHFSRVMAAANTQENLAFFQYNGDYQLQVGVIRMSLEEVTLTAGSQSLFTVYKGVEYTSGGDAVTQFNMNLSSANVLDYTAYSGSTAMVLDTTNQFKLEDTIVEGAQEINYQGALILKKGDTLAIKGKSKNIGDKLHFSLFTYEVREII